MVLDAALKADNMRVQMVTGERFATLMRELCRENGGTFVGLNHVEP